MLEFARGVGRLGQLQKTILKIGLQNRELEGRTGSEDQGADVLYAEAIIAYLGLGLSIHDHQGRRIYSARIADVEKVGKMRYTEAKAAVHACVRGMEKRGLVMSVRGLTGWSGANLSNDGVHVAKNLRGRGSMRRSARAGREHAEVESSQELLATS